MKMMITLREVAEQLCSWHLSNSKWNNYEAEYIAYQIVQNSYWFLQNKNELLTFAGTGLFNEEENRVGLNLLIEDGSVVLDTYDGHLVAGDDVQMRDGKPLVLRPTQDLLKYLNSLIKEKN